jgi:cytoskeletal protein RodZ
MKLFNRQKDDTPTISVTPPPPPQVSNVPLDEGSRIDWHRAAPRIAGLAICIVLIVLGILWIAGAFDSNSKEPSKQKSDTAQSDNKSKSDDTNKQKSSGNESNSASNGSSSNSTSNSNNSGAASTPAPSAATPSTTPATNDQLANTGPGETLAVIVVATAAGTLLYQFVLRRRTI